MGRKDKLRVRFQSIPADFTWKELCSMLNGFGYEMLTGSGSRRKFYKKSTGDLIILHEPHPGSIVKKYALKEVLEHLEEKGELK
jgi:predicted RNA binding protein YcfA (HicA-like mRNA interferase family)